MKKYILFLSFFLFSLTATYSQGTMEGNVVSIKNSLIVHASVKLLNMTGDSTQKEIFTDNAGYFRFENLTYGSYNLLISSPGFEKKKISVDFTPTSKKNSIQLEEESKLLKEVQVFGKKPLYEQQIDRFIINVQENTVTSNGTALEALERAPGLSIDKQKNNISLNGKEGVLVMINGKVSYQPIDVTIRMLDAMNAVNIKKIEIISNPPAEFDASGSGGIINIVLVKSEKEGLNGTYSFNTGFGLKEKGGSNLDISSNAKKYNIYSSLSYTHNHTIQKFSNERYTYLNSNLNERYTVSNRNPNTDNISARIGIDLKVDSLTSVGALISGYYNIWNMSADNSVKVSDNFALTSSLAINNSEINRWQNLSTNIYLSRKINKNEEINFDLNYLYYKNNNPTNYRNVTFDSQDNYEGEENTAVEKVTPVKIGIIKFDYNRIFGKSITWKSGMKSSFSSLSNKVVAELSKNNSFTIIDNLTNSSSYRENIGALYTELNIDLNLSTKFNAGLRSEFSNTILNSDENLSLKRSFFNLFPSLFFSKKISKNNIIQLSFSRRISRPSFTEMAPYVIYLDPATYFYGNTSLKSSLSSTYKLDYIYKKYILTFQYVNANDAIVTGAATLNQQMNQQIFTTINLKYLNSFSVILSMPLVVNNWWEMQLNILGVRQLLETTHLASNIYLAQNYIKLNNTQSFKLSDSFSMDISGVYQSKKLGGIAEVSPRGILDIGVQRKNANNVIRLSCSNMFNTNIENDYTSSKINNLNITEVYRLEPRIFRLSFSHKIGNNTKKYERETGSEDIKSRVN